MRCLQSISLLKVLASPQPTMCTTWTTRREVLPPATRRLCNIQVVFVGALFAVVQNGKRGKSLNEFCGGVFAYCGVRISLTGISLPFSLLLLLLSIPPANPIQCNPLHCSSYCLHFSSLVKKNLSKRVETTEFHVVTNAHALPMVIQLQTCENDHRIHSI